MKLAVSDKQILRELAGRYSELAHLPVQKERLARYQRSNDLEIVRPIVQGDTGAHISSHEYVDQLATEATVKGVIDRCYGAA